MKNLYNYTYLISGLEHRFRVVKWPSQEEIPDYINLNNFEHCVDCVKSNIFTVMLSAQVYVTEDTEENREKFKRAVKDALTKLLSEKQKEVDSIMTNLKVVDETKEEMM